MKEIRISNWKEEANNKESGEESLYICAFTNTAYFQQNLSGKRVKFPLYNSSPKNSWIATRRFHQIKNTCKGEKSTTAVIVQAQFHHNVWYNYDVGSIVHNNIQCWIRVDVGRTKSQYQLFSEYFWWHNGSCVIFYRLSVEFQTWVLFQRFTGDDEVMENLKRSKVTDKMGFIWRFYHVI